MYMSVSPNVSAEHSVFNNIAHLKSRVDFKRMGVNCYILGFLPLR